MWEDKRGCYNEQRTQGMLELVAVETGGRERTWILVQRACRAWREDVEGGEGGREDKQRVI